MSILQDKIANQQKLLEIERLLNQQQEEAVLEEEEKEEKEAQEAMRQNESEYYMGVKNIS